MKPIRVIPCLDVKDGRVVKGIRFVNLRDARDPVEAAETYCREGADELAFLDIAASVEGRGTKLEWVRRVSDKATVPFIVGGGIRGLEDMESLFELGVDKVSINTVAVQNPQIIKEATERFGRNKIIVAIDGKKNLTKSPGFEVLIRGGQEETGIDLLEWARKAEKFGASEILLTSKDTDGTKEGYDIPMTRAVAEAVSIPVIASGGAGKLEHMYQAVVEGKASAVLAASVFHFGGTSIRQVKEYLKRRGLPVNL